MKLKRVNKLLEENEEFSTNAFCQETLVMTVDFYKKTGFVPPWICYYVEINNELVGSAGFKGKPMKDTVEIACGTFEKFRKQGIGAKICKQLVDLSLRTNPIIRITARTRYQM